MEGNVATITLLQEYSLQIGKWQVAGVRVVHQLAEAYRERTQGGWHQGVYNQNDQSIQTFSKADYLNDCKIQRIAYNKTAKRLLIVETVGIDTPEDLERAEEFLKSL